MALFFIKHFATLFYFAIVFCNILQRIKNTTIQKNDQNHNKNSKIENNYFIYKTGMILESLQLLFEITLNFNFGDFIMKKYIAYTALTLAALNAGHLFAQTADGALGATSTGNIDLDLQVLDSVKITDMDGIDFSTYGAGDTGDINQGDAFCVYRNGGDGYTITPTSTNGAFALSGTNSNTDVIDYSVRLVGANTGAAAAAVVGYNAASATFNGSVFTDCGSVNNASIDVKIAEQEIRDATTDTYSDTLVLLVNPI